MPSRVLSPLPLLDVAAVKELLAQHGYKEAHAHPLWKRLVRDGDAAALELPRPDGVPAGCWELLVASCAAISSQVQEQVSSGPKSFKLVVRLQDARLVETVAIVHEARGGTQGRVTVCVSSQIGCKMGCTFCATGTMGFRGDLTAGEILEQVWHVERSAAKLGVHWRVSNVVFMGMGEPLNNYQARVCQRAPVKPAAEQLGTSARAHASQPSRPHST